jgi:hypothetical protein
MRLTWIAAAIAAAMGMAVPAFAGGEWPDGPNKLWFEGLQRPDNHLNPWRNLDQKSLFCCGIADTVKTKFKVEPGDERYPEDRWYAWLKDDWVRVPAEFPTLRLTGKLICFCSPARFNALSDPRVDFEGREAAPVGGLLGWRVLELTPRTDRRVGGSP